MGKKKIFTSDAWADFVAGITALKAKIDGKADVLHNHNNEYYTESEIDSKLANKSQVQFITWEADD